MTLPQVPLQLLTQIAQDITLRRALRLYWILKGYGSPVVKQSLARKLLRRHGCSYHEISKYIPWLVERKMLGMDKVNYYPRSQGNLGKLIEGHGTVKMRGTRFEIECLSNRKAFEDMMASLLIRREVTRISFSEKKNAKHRTYSVLLAKALHRAPQDINEMQRLRLQKRAAFSSSVRHSSVQAPIIESKMPLAKLGDVITGASMATLSRYRKRASNVRGVVLRENFTGCPFPEKEIEIELEIRSGFVRDRYYKGEGVPHVFSREMIEERMLPDGNLFPGFIKFIDSAIPGFIKNGVLPWDYKAPTFERPVRPWHKMRVFGTTPLIQEASSVICAPLISKCMTVKGNQKVSVLRTPESVAKVRAAKERASLIDNERAGLLAGAYHDVAMMENELKEIRGNKPNTGRWERFPEYRRLYNSIIFCKNF